MLRGARSAALAARPLVAAAAAAGLCAAGSVAACAQPKPCATEATIRGKRVPVTADPGVDACVATRSVVFQDWADSLPDGLDVESVHVQSVDLFGKPPKQRLGFVKFSASVKVDGHPAPGIVFMRGGAVCVLMVLESEGQEYALVTRQPRVPIASSGFDEIPAGMLDGSGAFAGTAAKELEEETGIIVEASELVDLTHLAYGAMPRSRALKPLGKGAAGDVSDAPVGEATCQGIYPSPGACDEFLRVFLFRKNMSKAELADLQSRIYGAAHEAERIALRVVPLGDLWRWTPDCKTLSALMLYEKLREAGRV